MNNREQYKRMFVFASNAVTLIFETAIFAYMWYAIYWHMMDNPFYRRGNWAAVGLYMLCMFFFTRTYGGYQLGYLRTSEACLSHALAILCGNVVGYLELCMLTVDYLPLKPMVFATLIEIAAISVWVIIVRKGFKRLYPPHKMIVIYGDYSPENMIDKMNSRRDRYDVCALVSMKMGFDKIYKMIPDYEEVLLCDLPSQTRNKLLKYCFDHSIRTYVTPKVSDIIMAGMDDIYMFDTPLYLARNQGLTPPARFVKRVFDITLSVIGLVIASPFMLIIAICIKAYDGGSIFYRQERLTLNGRSFNIIKFRSMCVDSEKHGARLAKKNDDRITPIGKVLRNIHMDELPQLFNVLKGDMSIVGPRPERPEIFEQYEELIPEFVFRLKVKAGLTGFAQVHGRYNTTPYDKLKLDMTYIQQFSLIMDFKLVLMTVKILFQKENTEGVDNDQVTAVKDHAKD